jgi:hypothetical protein
MADRHLACNLLGAPLNTQVEIHIGPDFGIYTAPDGQSKRCAEGFNSAIQLIKANARGFRNFTNYRARILFHCGKLNLAMG